MNINFLCTYVLNFIFEAIAVGLVFTVFMCFVTWCCNRKYRGWKLTVVPENSERVQYSSQLWWEEVQRFEQSKFEMRKFIQSICTSESLRIRSGQIEAKDKDFWFLLDNKEKKITVDFTHASFKKFKDTPPTELT